MRKVHSLMVLVVIFTFTGCYSAEKNISDFMDESREPYIRQRGLLGISNLGSGEFKSFLRQQLAKEGSADARIEAARIMGNLGCIDFIPDLHEASDDPVAEVRFAVINARDEIAAVPYPPVIAKMVRELGESPHLLMRANAAITLGALSEFRAADALAARAEDPSEDVYVRICSIEALGNMDGANVIASLLHVIESGDEELAEFARESILKVRERLRIKLDQVQRLTVEAGELETQLQVEMEKLMTKREKLSEERMSIIEQLGNSDVIGDDDEDWKALFEALVRTREDAAQER
ncbi:MAG: HEAT repeat domain-containing protein [Planctomycetes bacterium]|nr:HEAT repeat domain-containing protein [Planctomycetota bacterium]